MDTSIVKKNSNEFSVVKEVLNEVVNLDFRHGEKDFVNTITNGAQDTSRSYIWSSISAVADDVGEEIYEKILNYVADICDIDTCSVKSLQSMIEMLGADYSIVNSIKDCPLEIQKLIDIFSIRKDYLLNSEHVSKQLASYILDNAVSSYTIENPTDDEKTSEISVHQFQAESLDKLISSTYFEVLKSNVYLRYNTLDKQVIHKALSGTILDNSFALSNKYAEDIYAYKIKWNIPIEYDTAAAADAIDQGLSVMSDFNEHEQKLLEYEFKHRSDPKYELEKKSRYSYYREAKVKEYFKFIEQWYSNKKLNYFNAQAYPIDKNYVEVKSLVKQPSLLRTNAEGKVCIDRKMMVNVAEYLLEVTKSIRNIREHLKSYAQKTCMKGTWQLMRYSIAEYIRNNIYPSLKKLGYKIPFEADANSIDLIEYADGTMYNNITTDIKEDKSHLELNSEYWNSVGANGNLDAADGGSLFKPESKTRLLGFASLDDAEIEAFYKDVLNVFQTENVHEPVSKLLSATYALGADNTYKDVDGKIVCEMHPEYTDGNLSSVQASRRFTHDIDAYISSLNSAYEKSKFIFKGFTPIQNTPIQSQLSAAMLQYRAKATDEFQIDQNAFEDEIQSEISRFEACQEELELIQQDFQLISARFNDLTTLYEEAYSTKFSPLTNEALSFQIKRFQTHTLNDLKPDFASAAASIISECDLLINSLNSLKSQCRNLIPYSLNSTYTDALSSFMIKGIDFDYSGATAKCIFKLNKQFILSKSLNEIMKYELERIYVLLSELFTNLTSNLRTALMIAQTEIKTQISEHFQSAPFHDFNTLSALLSGYYLDTFPVTSCVKEISARLDYTQNSWYKYKSELFDKYTGLSTSLHPYYYIENARHPSYQTHPAMRNFYELNALKFAIGNIVGTSQSLINQIVKAKLDEMLDEDGYLIDVWKNPLNQNSDYTTRYEEANHIDALGQVNKYFGYDGIAHPDAASDNADLEAAHSGLNLASVDIQHIKDQLQEFNGTWNEFTQNSTIKIKRYAIDVYQNQYILIEAENVEPQLFIRFKNHVYPFPALAYKNDKYSSYSQITRKLGHFNELFDDVKMCNVLGESEYWTPVIQDFFISKDRETMIFRCQSNDGRSTIPVHVNIVQEQQRLNHADSYVRFFENDEVNGSQHCLISDLPPAAFYTDGTNIGQLYLSATTDAISVQLDKYVRNSHDSAQTSAEAVIACLDHSIKNADVKVDVQNNGDFSIAYIADYSLSADEGIITFEDQYVSSYYDTALDPQINTISNIVITRDFRVVGPHIIEKPEQFRQYMPFVDMGFIPVFKTADNSNLADLSNLSNLNEPLKELIVENPRNLCRIDKTSWQNDLYSMKPLKFELFGISSDQNSGIDFKYVYPLHRFEDHEICADYKDVSYHRDGTEDISCFRYDDLHFLESKYNKYVLGADDAFYWDMTDIEQKAYLSSWINNDEHLENQFGDYHSLAKYDVARHLSVRRSDNYDNDLTQHLDLPLDAKQLTELFLLDDNVYKNHANEISTYLSGFYDGDRNSIIDENPGEFLIKLKNTSDEISVKWLYNDENTIKIDFNTALYRTPMISDHEVTIFDAPDGATLENLEMPETETRTFVENARNRLHLFLNLDRPGDSGYLYLYNRVLNDPEDSETLYSDELDLERAVYKLFIKNISYKGHPRFVMKLAEHNDREYQEDIFIDDSATSEFTISVDDDKDLQKSIEMKFENARKIATTKDTLAEIIENAENYLNYDNALKVNLDDLPSQLDIPSK